MTTQELIAPYVEEMIETRRHIHQHPELSLKEYETTALVKARMKEYGIEVAEIGMPTGVVALLRGGKPGKTIALREDMDALPMQEATGLPFASVNEGVCHACGHDMHTTILIYCAKVLSEIREELSGNVLFLFQPAEEAGGGARQFIAHGFDKVAKPDLFLGCHVNPATPVGKVGYVRGVASASSDSFALKVKGLGFHGAHPEQGIDPIVCAANIIMTLQTVISRKNYPINPAVLSIGAIHAGQASNVVPDEVEIKGTLRNLNTVSRQKNKEKVQQICEGIAASMDCTVEFEWMGEGYPVRIHGDEAVDLMKQAAEEVLGAEKVFERKQASLGSEDFGELFPRFAPGMQFVLGTSNDDPATHIGIHNVRNIFDEGALSVGLSVMVQAVRDYLK